MIVGFSGGGSSVSLGAGGGVLLGKVVAVGASVLVGAVVSPGPVVRLGVAVIMSRWKGVFVFSAAVNWVAVAWRVFVGGTNGVVVEILGRGTTTK